VSAIFEPPRQSLLGQSISLCFHVLLFVMLASMGNGRKDTFQPTQVVEIATLLLQPQPEVSVPAAQNPAPSLPPPQIETEKRQPEPSEKTQAKPKSKPKPKPKPVVTAKPQPLAGKTITETVTSGNETLPVTTSNPEGGGVGSVSPNSSAKAIGGSKGDQVVVADYRSATLHNPPTFYPRAAVVGGLQGTVELRIQVLANGQPGDIQIYKSSGYDILDKSAVQQVRAWHFLPARRGDQAIISWVVVPINFRIKR
jgi:protein TonB